MNAEELTIHDEAGTHLIDMRLAKVQPLESD